MIIDHHHNHPSVNHQAGLAWTVCFYAFMLPIVISLIILIIIILLLTRRDLLGLLLSRGAKVKISPGHRHDDGDDGDGVGDGDGDDDGDDGGDGGVDDGYDGRNDDGDDGGMESSKSRC